MNLSVSTRSNYVIIKFLFVVTEIKFYVISIFIFVIYNSRHVQISELFLLSALFLLSQQILNDAE